jgi:hypothetical protein
MQLTKQGVRDLNGPQMNGRSYNGRKDGHKHNPDSPYRTEFEERIVMEPVAYGCIETIKRVKVRYCAFCNEELSTSLD